MMASKIEWCDETWNPTIGCRKASEGCRNCYAERMATRLAAMGVSEYQEVVTNPRLWDRDQWNGRVKCLPDRLNIPLKWKKPRRVFVDSMSDLFHEDVPSGFIFDVLRTIRECEQHTFIILTKRAKRMSEWFNHYYCGTVPYPNIWLLVSIENQATADERIPWLLETPAAVRGVSVEPMLGTVDLHLHDYAVSGTKHSVRRTFLDQVICGCESGPRRRPMDIEWARSLRDQCQAAGVPFFLKQMEIDDKLVKMPELDGVVWDQYPREDGE